MTARAAKAAADVRSRKPTVRRLAWSYIAGRCSISDRALHRWLPRGNEAPTCSGMGHARPMRRNRDAVRVSRSLQVARAT